jgi:hypothetical protein
MLLKTALENLVAYEPSLQIFPMLTASIEGESRVEAINEFFGAGSAGGFDSIPYINVLEHIENDKAELAIMRDKLVPDGHVLIFVPALPALFSDFDKSIGHYRRYRKVQLADTLRESGFSIEKIKYFDCAGVNFVLLKKTLSGNHVSLYDKIVVPVMRRLESFIAPPIGKNILVVAKKHEQKLMPPFLLFQSCQLHAQFL